MRKHLLVATTAVSLAAVAGAGAAGAAPTGKYTVACSAAGTTTATWQHARLSLVTFAWSRAGVATGSFAVPASPTPPRGSTIQQTPAGSDSVTVTFERADGSGADPVTVPCT